MDFATHSARAGTATARPAAVTCRLAELLDQAACLGPEYGPGLSSHLPMALAALAAIGADDARLQQYFDRASRRFGPPRPPVVPRSLGAAWLALRGQLDAYDALVGHFSARLLEEGADRVLCATLPPLLDGVGAAAFHGLIRTACAAAHQRPAEVAAALAYWACRWLPLPRATAGTSAEVSVDDWIARLLAAPTRPRPAGRLITDRIEGILQTATYAGLAGRLQPVPPGDRAAAAALLARLAALAVARYNTSLNFTVLHLVTGTHALRLVWRWLDDPAAAVAHFADAFAAAYLVSGITPGGDALGSARLEWPEILARARVSDDDHVIKLVHSCQAEAVHHRDAEEYRLAASRAVA